MAAGLPTKETWNDSIRAGNYDTRPGINVKAVNKYFPESDDTQKGNMRSKVQGHCSTNPNESKPSPRTQTNQHEMFIKVVDLKETMYSYKTGKFLYLSRKGMIYIIILYHIDAKYILSEPMRNKKKPQMLKTYKNIIM